MNDAPDLLDRLADHRPTDAALDRLWSPERRAALRERLTEPRPVVRRRPRRVLLAAAAALVVAVPVVHEVVAPDAAQARADLTALAATAAADDGPVLAPGQYLHVRTHSEQHNRWPREGGETYINDRDAWIGWDGSYTAVETRPTRDEIAEWFRNEDTGKPSIHDPTPAFAATLPTDAEAFRAYLEPRVSGSNSHEEALYSAVTSLIRSQYLPPDTLAAALGALADVDGVRTEDVTVEGREAVRISYDRFVVSWVSEDSVTVDRATAQPLRDENRSLQGSYRSDVLEREVVDALPAEVTAVFAAHPDGVLLCPDGSEAVGGGDVPHC
ncbi:CU044_5270 family protein [Nocardioides flavescens]|uniref:CU044_5270 family protein n=1 Tax=Nocardioides flavescens TaxID=2691959 RepID=A0A6L7EPA2_9ACTN|nr:CU044_5270 family protein [Nocardioides flavescens]MXG89187.1 hypothetical protein [Nocardioides flavescens]